MSAPSVLLEKSGAVATITLNRPDRYNAINQDLKEAFKGHLNDCKNDDNIRVIILTGSGKGFCAGADMMDLASNPSPRDVRDDLQLNYGAIIRLLTDMHKPVICAINGPIAGAGIGFGLACDYKIMADSASLRFAFANIGLVSDAGATWFLTREVGYTKALEIIYEGNKIPASECLKLGIVNEVVPRDEILDAAKKKADYLVQKSPLAFDATKKAIKFAMTNGLFDTISFEGREQMSLIVSEDHKEAVQAFIEKRSPEFKGK